MRRRRETSHRCRMPLECSSNLQAVGAHAVACGSHGQQAIAWQSLACARPPRLPLCGYNPDTHLPAPQFSYGKVGAQPAALRAAPQQKPPGQPIHFASNGVRQLAGFRPGAKRAELPTLQQKPGRSWGWPRDPGCMFAVVATWWCPAASRHPHVQTAASQSSCARLAGSRSLRPAAKQQQQQQRPGQATTSTRQLPGTACKIN